VTWFQPSESLDDLVSLLREAEDELMALGMRGDEEPYWEILGSIRLTALTVEQLRQEDEPDSFHDEEPPPEAPQATVLRLVPGA